MWAAFFVRHAVMTRCEGFERSPPIAAVIVMTITFFLNVTDTGMCPHLVVPGSRPADRPMSSICRLLARNRTDN